MKLIGLVVVVLLTEFATSLAEERRLSCSCQLSKVTYQTINIDCGNGPTNPQQPSGKKELTCSKEIAGSVPGDYEFVPGVGFYKLFRTYTTYEKALARCKQDGAFLAVPNSKAEAQAISEIMKKTPRVGEAFIGINNRDKTGFHSIQGELLSSLGYKEWAPGQPDNNHAKGELCVSIYPDGRYNDINCDYVLHFVCQRPVSKLPPSGYKYVPRHGFYKHYLVADTYDGARQRCINDGGHLAVLDTQEEADEVLKFYDINTNVFESYVGLNDVGHEGFFISETGKPVSQLGFTNWYSNEPNNANAEWGENCVTFYYLGTMNDVVCSLRYPFFCEIPIPNQ